MKINTEHAQKYEKKMQFRAPIVKVEIVGKL